MSHSWAWHMTADSWKENRRLGNESLVYSALRLEVRAVATSSTSDLGCEGGAGASELCPNSSEPRSLASCFL